MVRGAARGRRCSSPDGTRRTESARLAGHTLIWQDGGTTLRLEGDLSLERARRDRRVGAYRSPDGNPPARGGVPAATRPEEAAVRPCPRITHRRRPGRGVVPDVLAGPRSRRRADQRAAVGPRRGEDRVALLHRPRVRRPRRPGRGRRATGHGHRSTGPGASHASGPGVTVTWLIHDVTPWRVDHIYLDGPRARRGSRPRSRARAAAIWDSPVVWHQPHGRPSCRCCSTSSASVGPRAPRATTSTAWPAPRVPADAEYRAHGTQPERPSASAASGGDSADWSAARCSCWASCGSARCARTSPTSTPARTGSRLRPGRPSA